MSLRTINLTDFKSLGASKFLQEIVYKKMPYEFEETN